MKGFIGIVKRNLKVYFQDVQAVVFSLLTSIIVFVLYLLFLKGSFVNAINGAMQGLESFIEAGDVEVFANSILLSGIMGSALITVSFATLNTFVRDKETRIAEDVLTTPVSRAKIVTSYFVSSSIASTLMTSFIFTVGLGILSASGRIYLSAADIVKSYGVIALGAVSATAFLMIIMTFFKDTSASAAFFGILSAAAGFVIGAYIPISEFSAGVKTICNIFPASHVTVMIRNTLMNGVLSHMNDSIGGVDNGEFVKAMKEVFGFRTEMMGKALSLSASGIYVIAIAAVCIATFVVIYQKTYKRR